MSLSKTPGAKMKIGVSKSGLTHSRLGLTAFVLAAGVTGSSLLAQQQPQPTTQAADAGARGGARGGGGARYPIPYRAVTPEQIAEVLNRVFAYADANSPSRIVDRQTNVPI